MGEDTPPFGAAPLWTIGRLSTQNALDSRGDIFVKRYFEPTMLLAAALSMLGPAAAQPVQPMPTASAPVAELLTASPRRDISNGLITARLGTVDGTRGFYRGTRFDQAGQVLSLTLNGKEFYGPWFDATAPDVLDYAYDATGQVVAGPDSAASGPVEEFAPLDFTPASGSHFVKIGVGILYQPDTAPYDHYRHYRILWMPASAPPA